MKILLAALLILPTLASAQENRSWILLQRQANGGIGKIVHDLSAHECMVARNDIQARQDILKAQQNGDQEFSAEWMRSPHGSAMLEQARTDHPECKDFVVASSDGGPADVHVEGSVSGNRCIVRDPEIKAASRPTVPRDADITSADCLQ